MKRLILVIALAAVCGSCASQSSGERPQLFEIHRPTIVAFFLPVTEAETNNGNGESEALGDFNHYASLVRKRLKNAGIDFYVTNAPSFQVRTEAKVRTFQTGDVGVGYYLITPGKEPYVLNGVMTDKDLVDAAGAYFRVAIQ
jgi:hypothetical protein